jgi:hypothetical protein
MVPRWKQQVGGLLMALQGAGSTGWISHAASHQGYFYPQASMCFLAVFALRLGIVAFPGRKEERIARGENISRLQGWTKRPVNRLAASATGARNGR